MIILVYLLRYNSIMKKIYKIEVDCANCANKVEEEANKIEGIKSASVNFMMLKMTIDFEDGINIEDKLKEIRTRCKKIDDDFEIYN